MVFNLGLWGVVSCFSIAVATVDAVDTVQAKHFCVRNLPVRLLVIFITITPKVDVTDVTDIVTLTVVTFLL